MPFRDSSEGSSGTSQATAREADFNGFAKACTVSEDAESPEGVSGQLAKNDDALYSMSNRREFSTARSTASFAAARRAVGKAGASDIEPKIEGAAFEGQRRLSGRQRCRPAHSMDWSIDQDGHLQQRPE